MKALFIGLGSIGQRHLRNLIKLAPSVELLAVRRSRIVPVLDNSNQVIGGAADLKERYSLTEYNSLKEALGASPHLIFITGPSSRHLSDLRYCLAHSSAPIFVEKPAAHDLAGLIDLIKIEDQGRSRVMVGFQYRFNPLLTYAKRLLDSAEIGNIVSASLVNSEYMPDWHPYEDYRGGYAARSDLGGGALLTQIHDLDYACWFFGAPKSVYALGGRLSNLNIDVEDSVTILMSCSSTFTEQIFPVSIALDYLGRPPKKSFTVVGDAGRIDADLLSGSLLVHRRSEPTQTTYDYSSFKRNDVFLEELSAFLRFAREGGSPPIGLKDAKISLKIATLSKKSMSLNEVVRYDE